MSVVERVTASRDNYDEISELIDSLSYTPDAQPTAVHGLTSSIVQIFGILAKDGALTAAQGASKTDKVTVEWLNTQLEEFAKQTLKFAASEQPVVAEIAFEATMKLVLIQWKYRQDWASPLLQQLVKETLFSQNELFGSLWTKYFAYDDARFFFLRAIPEALAANEAEAGALQAEYLQNVLSSFEKFPAEDSDIRKFYGGRPAVPKDQIKTIGNPLKASAHKLAFQKAWLATMKLPLNMTQLKDILTILHVKIIPHMQKPQLLMDFLTDSYNYGGSIALLALNSLFSLIQEYNLDYPEFFKKLYLLLEDGSILVSSHRARFLRLLDLFLTSTHLPATIPASIIKRLARLSLFAPPGAIVAIIPFVYNQLKRNPTCMLMIHREKDIVGPECDPFDPSETDPLLTHAIESSLWEISALTNHYQPNIAALAKIMSQPFRKPSYQLEHFLAHSYETLYAAEYNRKSKNPPALEFEELELFSDAPDGSQNYLESWSL